MQIFERIKEKLQKEMEDVIVKDTYTKGKNAGLRKAEIFVDEVSTEYNNGMTNADFIRQMDDEELAELLTNEKFATNVANDFCLYRCEYRYAGGCKLEDDSCPFAVRDDVLLWLRSKLELFNGTMFRPLNEKFQIPNIIHMGKIGSGMTFRVKLLDLFPDLTTMVESLDFSDFTVTTCNRDYLYIENLFLKDLQAKHIIIRNDQTEKIYQEAIYAGHPNIMWGNTRGGTVESEKMIIEKMITDDFRNSIRITITDDHIWSDNNHSTISYIRRGYEKVGQVPHYIVDCRTTACKLIGSEKDIIWNPDSIQNAIRRAFRLELFEGFGGRKTSWTIGELMDQVYQ